MRFFGRRSENSDRPAARVAEPSPRVAPKQDEKDTAAKQRARIEYMPNITSQIQQIVLSESGIPVDSLTFANANQIRRLLEEHVTYCLLENFDTNTVDFIISLNGQPPVYNQLFTMIKDRKIPKKHLRMLEVYIKKVEAVSDKQYREIFRQYAEALYPCDSAKIEAFLDKIVERKRNLRAAYREFIRIQLHFNPDQILSAEPDRPINRDQLPKTLSHFDEYEASYADSRQDVRELEADAEAKSIFDRAMRSMVTTENFCMHMPSDVLLAVLNEGRQGRFKQLMETGASKGFRDTGRRVNTTKNLFGAEIDKLEPKDYQKYGHLGRTKGADSYGDAIVTFKKHRLKEVTTFTEGNSGMSVFIASKITNPRSTAFFSTQGLSTRMRNYLENGNLLKFLEGVVLSHFIELQYHGELTVDDIERVVFTRIPDNLEIFAKLNERYIPYMIKFPVVPIKDARQELKGLKYKTIPLRFELDTDPPQEFIAFLAANKFRNCSFTLKQEPSEVIKKLLSEKGYIYKVRA